jgi:hypothetical protein
MSVETGVAAWAKLDSGRRRRSATVAAHAERGSGDIAMFGAEDVSCAPNVGRVSRRRNSFDGPPCLARGGRQGWRAFSSDQDPAPTDSRVTTRPPISRTLFTHRLIAYSPYSPLK